MVGGCDPQGVPFEDHAAFAVFGIRFPADLGVLSRRNGEAKAPGPIRTAHPRPGHADDAAGQHDEEGGDEGDPGRPPNPECEAVRCGGHGQREDSGA